jgi:hypothetical protein
MVLASMWGSSALGAYGRAGSSNGIREFLVMKFNGNRRLDEIKGQKIFPKKEQGIS